MEHISIRDIMSNEDNKTLKGAVITHLYSKLKTTAQQKLQTDD